MRVRACIAVLLLLSACATSAPGTGAHVNRDPRLANLERAAALPWRDEGRCVVREASQPWPVVVERCFHALDEDRVRFKDSTGRCAVASAGAAAVGIGFCVLAAPEVVVGAVVVLGVVMVGVVIKEALDAYEEARVETRPTPLEPLAKRRPRLEPAGQDVFPPAPNEPRDRERRPECKPQRVPHRGGNKLHNECADGVPKNAFVGWDALVNGKNFDALQESTRTLWEVKTNAIETYSPYVLRAELEDQVTEARRERDIAAFCGYDFVIGVRSEVHKKLLEQEDFTLKVVVMEWC